MNPSTKMPPEANAMAGDVAKLPLEVRALFASFQRQRLVPRDRREDARRRQFVFPVPMQLRGANGSEAPTRTVCVHTRDRTDACISFLTDTILPTNAVVMLDFTTAPETASLGKLERRVRRCRQFREGWFECLAEVGGERRQRRSAWARFKNWMSETSGLRPDRRQRREPARRYRRAG